MNTIKYYFFTLKDDLSSHKTTWKNPKCKLLNESSQFEKVTYHVIPAKWHSEKDKTIEMIKAVKVSCLPSLADACSQHWNTSLHASSVTKLYLTLCDPMECSPPGSSVHRILQARKLRVACHFLPRGSCWPMDQTQVSCISCIVRQILYQWATWEAQNIGLWI